MDVHSRAEIVNLLDGILAKDNTGNTEAATQIEKLIEELYSGSSKEQRDAVGERYRTSFGLDGTGGEGRIQPVTYRPKGTLELPQQGGHLDADTGRARTNTTHDRPDFETLVPDGWFKRYIEWTAEHESPVQYHFASALTIISSGIGRETRIDWEARDIYPNLYSLLIGPTGARKGAAIDKALQLVVPAMGCPLLPSEGTHQGFAEALRRRLDDTGGLCSDGLIVAPEFSVLMSKDSNKSDLVKWLTDWYDSPKHWARALRGDPDYELRNVCVSVLGGSNIAWLRTMPADAITGGFMPRFVLFDAQDKRFWKARPRFSSTLEKELQNQLVQAAENLPECIGFDDEAGRYLDYWYEHDIREAYEASTDEQYQAWLARKQAAAMKIAAVWQIADGGPKDVIHKKWLHQARTVVDWGDTSVDKIYGVLGVTQEAQVTDDVLHEVRKRGGRATKRAIIKALRKTYLAPKIASAINTLRASGDVTVGNNVAEGDYVQIR